MIIHIIFEIMLLHEITRSQIIIGNVCKKLGHAARLSIDFIFSTLQNLY